MLLFSVPSLIQFLTLLVASIFFFHLLYGTFTYLLFVFRSFPHFYLVFCYLPFCAALIIIIHVQSIIAVFDKCHILFHLDTRRYLHNYLFYILQTIHTVTMGNFDIYTTPYSQIRLFMFNVSVSSLFLIVVSFGLCLARMQRLMV